MPSKQQQLLALLREHKTLTNLQDFPKNFITALKIAGYIEIARATSGSGRAIQSIRLLKDIGDKPIRFDRGVLYDYNNGEEININNTANKTGKNRKQRILQYVLDAIITLNLEETTKQVIFEEAKKLSPTEISVPHALNRWIEKLIQIEAIRDTGERYRNAKILEINLKKVKEVRKKFDTVKNYNLLFGVFVKLG